MKTSWKSRRPHAIALALAAGMLAGAIALPTPLRAQASSPTAVATEKMQLQLDALTAKRDGDFTKAKELLQKIIALDPKDPNTADIQRQIDVINAALVSQSAGKPTIFDASAGNTTATTTAVTTRPLPADSADTAAAAPAKADAPAPAPSPTAEAKASLAAEAARQQGQINAIRASIQKAEALTASGDFDGARAAFDAAMTQVPAGIKFTDIRNQIKMESNETWFTQALASYKSNNLADAKTNLDKYVEVAGTDTRSTALAKNIAAAQNDPTKQSYKDVVSPGFEESQEKVQQLLVKGRAQFLYGDFQGAILTFNEVKNLSPDNVEAKAYRVQIDKIVYGNDYMNREETRWTLLQAVEKDWNLPTFSAGNGPIDQKAAVESPLMAKMKTIFIPSVNIDVPTPLDQVVQVLHDLSVRYDPDGKGINFHVYAPSSNEPMPKVTLSGLNGLSLADLLKIACGDAHPAYAYNVDGAIIALREGGSQGVMNSDFVQERIPLSESMMKELGINLPSSSDAAKPAAASDPFAAPGAASPAPTTDATPASSTDDTGKQLMSKFIDNNIEFPAGSKVSMLGTSKISVVNTPQNIEKLKQFLRQLDDVKQVQIEARFLDISQGALKSLGARWDVSRAGHQNDFLTTGTTQANNLRPLSDAFSSGASGAAPTLVTGLPISTLAGNQSGVQFLAGSIVVPQVVPTLPGAINTGSGSSDMFSGVVSWLDGYKINLVLDALDQEQGADLMSSPKLTVMDGTDAHITIAQEFRYPQQFSGVTSTVSPASGNSSGGGGVSINAGTPSGFEVEQIGVTMNLTPNVQPDDSIRLFITPNVTEFEGFIEYGSSSIAIQGSITAIVPSGVIQPIFNVRTLQTTVTIYDGATVVMGGLTRDEVKSVNDKVPVLGDIPFIGRLFQSKGESSQKRNLMIFVTANLIGPGGAPAAQSFQNLQRGAIFSNPTLLLPAGTFQRSPPSAGGTPSAEK